MRLRLLNGIGWAWLAAVLVCTSEITTDFSTFLVLLAFLATLGLVWLVLSGVEWFRRDAAAEKVARNGWASWAALPVIALLGLGAARFQLGLKARTLLSSRALSREIASLTGPGETHPIGRRVGLFHVESIGRDGDQWFVATRGSHGFYEDCYLARTLSGEPQAKDLRQARHSAGSWWRVCFGWD